MCNSYPMYKTTHNLIFGPIQHILFCNLTHSKYQFELSPAGGKVWEYFFAGPSWHMGSALNAVRKSEQWCPLTHWWPVWSKIAAEPSRESEGWLWASKGCPLANNEMYPLLIWPSLPSYPLAYIFKPICTKRAQVKTLVLSLNGSYFDCNDT